MKFAAPEWFLLVPVFVYIGWRWRSLKLREPLRMLCLALVVLLMVQPQVRKLRSGLDLWLMVDRSSSAEAEIAPRMQEVKTLLEKTKGPHDRLRIVDFAHDAVERMDEYSSIGEKRDATRMAAALEYTLGRMQPDRAARVLMLTDGYSTEPLAGMRERLIRQQVALDYRTTEADRTNDWSIRDFASSTRVRQGEPIVLQARVLGPVRSAKVAYRVFRDEQEIFSGDTELENGAGSIRLSDRLAQPGGHRYMVELNPPREDEISGNDRASVWVEVIGGDRFLLVTRYANDPVGKALRAQGYTVDEETEFSRLNAARLSGAQGVILNNVPANVLPAPFLRDIDFYVRAQGGGLLMTGGKYSYGSGGYFQSTIDGLLPVSMELKQEHRKMSVALAIVMDRSGSMAASAGPGATKMDLANEGAARAVELLGARDAVTVFAVDSEPHQIVPLTNLEGNRQELMNVIRRVQSTGGGIYVYTGMLAAWEQLKKAEVGQRHLILFADAADAEEPGDYKVLVEEMVKEGASISVIGLGSHADSDAKFLEDIAARGNGRIFFNADPSQLPALFAQETVAIARSAYLEDPVSVLGMPGWLEMAARSIEWPKQVDGYNLSYVRPNATVAAVSGDEYSAPLAAFWQRESGRVAAVSFPLSGKEAELTLAWPQYTDFVQTLGRWLAGPPAPPGVGLRTKLDGSRLTVDLFYDRAIEAQVARSTPSLVVVEGADKPKGISWERQAPGHFQASFDLEGSTPIRGVVEFGGATFPFGPISAATIPEWAFSQDRLQELRALSLNSGGVERTDLTKIWDAPRRAQFTGIEVILATLLLCSFVLETLLTRTGWKLPLMSWGWRPGFAPKYRKAPKPKRKKDEPPAPPAPEAAGETAEDAAKQRRARFARARRGEG